MIRETVSDNIYQSNIGWKKWKNKNEEKTNGKEENKEENKEGDKEGNKERWKRRQERKVKNVKPKMFGYWNHLYNNTIICLG